MSREKQIEEMAKTINKSDILCHTCGESTYTYCAEAVAEYLHANGYRKTTDVAREISDEIERLSKILQSDYRKDNSETAELIEHATDYFLYEIKKKYTEGGGLNEIHALRTPASRY